MNTLQKKLKISKVKGALKSFNIWSVKKWVFKDYTELNPWLYIYPSFEMGRGKKRATYSELPLSFDIETTSTEIDGNKVAWVYHWQIGIGNDCYYGRELKDAIFVFDDIAERFKDEYVICWIHNLSYEFSFLTEYIEFEDIFATAPNHPIKCRYKNIIFRCSYAFSNMSLNLLSQTYTNTKKAKGDLDYDVIRYPNTPLTHREKYYCYCDVKVLTEYWQMHILPTYIKGKKRKWLPLTNTAKVRNDMQGRISNWKEYKKLYSSVYPTEDMYAILRQCFYGGIVRANAKYWGRLLTDVASRDRTSSYPAVQLHYLYPMGRFVRVNPKNIGDFGDEYCKIYKVRFHNLKAIAPISIIPYDKAKTSPDVVLDNGRIYSATICELYCTDVDFSWWLKYYKGSYKIVECYVSKKGRLCHFQVDSLIDYYIGKSRSKGVMGMAETYLKKKNMLNSNFGCCVQKHNDESLEYCRDTGEWIKQPVPYEQKQSEFLLYQVGVWITAYARSELLRSVYEIWQDDLKNGRECAVVYLDTDSCKYLYRDGIYEHIFDKIDKEMEKLTRKSAEYYGFDLDEYILKIGKWDLETLKYDDSGNVSRETYESFKTLGSKRYIHDGEPTISGLPIDGFKNYCKKYNLPPEEVFKCGRVFSPHDINKLAMTYTVTKNQYVISNNGETWLTPTHFVHAQRVGFKLDISKSYRHFINDIIKQTGKRGI